MDEAAMPVETAVLDRSVRDQSVFDRTNVAVVIPALNEALRIREVVEGALGECDRVIVIDDGSDDDTAAKIADLPITLLRHPQRMGKGASLRDGFREAERLGMAAVTITSTGGRRRCKIRATTPSICSSVMASLR